MSTEADSAARFTHIPITSSLTSGFAALLFDVFLLMIIRSLAQSLCSTANIYLIYDKRTTVSPVISRLGFLTGAPVGPRNLSRLFSLIIATATACVIVLGFSINGKTVQQYQSRVYRSVIKVTQDAAQIDYENEYEFRNSDLYISKHLAVLADSFACLDNSYNISEIYGFAYKDEDLQGMIHSEVKVDNAECVKQPQFETPIINHRFHLQAPGPPFPCKIDSIQPNHNQPEHQGTFESDFEMDPASCEVAVDNMYCFKRQNKTACSAIGKKKSELSSDDYYVLLVANVSRTDEVTIDPIPHNLNPDQIEQIAYNIAFFSVIGIGGQDLTNLANAARTRIFHNIPLVSSAGGHNISEVDMRMAVPSFGFVVSAVVLLFVANVIFFFQVIYMKGRKGYNTFSTIPEVMQLADNTQGRKLRRPGFESCYVGISRQAPKIVVASSETRGVCHGAVWTEDEIESGGNTDAHVVPPSVPLPVANMGFPNAMSQPMEDMEYYIYPPR